MGWRSISVSRGFFEVNEEYRLAHYTFDSSSVTKDAVIVTLPSPYRPTQNYMVRGHNYNEVIPVVMGNGKITADMKGVTTSACRINTIFRY